MLRLEGFSVDLYDPFFFPNKDIFANKYNFITCTETAEHFFNPNKEFETLNPLCQKLFEKYDGELQTHYLELARINGQLWDIEDWIRDCEREKRFDAEFIQLARSVYVTNDRRSKVKKEINLLTKSGLVEEKSYKDYK